MLENIGNKSILWIEQYYRKRLYSAVSDLDKAIHILCFKPTLKMLFLHKKLMMVKIIK